MYINLCLFAVTNKTTVFTDSTNVGNQQMTLYAKYKHMQLFSTWLNFQWTSLSFCFLLGCLVHCHELARKQETVK